MQLYFYTDKDSLFAGSTKNIFILTISQGTVKIPHSVLYWMFYLFLVSHSPIALLSMSGSCISMGSSLFSAIHGFPGRVISIFIQPCISILFFPSRRSFHLDILPLAFLSVNSAIPATIFPTVQKYLAGLDSRYSPIDDPEPI